MPTERRSTIGLWARRIVGGTDLPQTRTDDHGAKGFSTRRSTGRRLGKWRSRTVVKLLSSSQATPAGLWTSGVKSVVKKRPLLRRRDALRTVRTPNIRNPYSVAGWVRGATSSWRA